MERPMATLGIKWSKSSGSIISGSISGIFRSVRDFFVRRTPPEAPGVLFKELPKDALVLESYSVEHP
ncbi:hypothetical protein KEJ13_09835, partial [Candidatus Bathyarchaeota archaeon]|nr:hypothetical protein [Candidatus Bathyarchaeota archaeon]